MQSTVFTIGTALGRARDHGAEVRVLVSGHWIEGAVSEVDGHGVLITGPDGSHHVVRLTDVSAVQVKASRPAWEAPPASEPDCTDDDAPHEPDTEVAAGASAVAVLVTH